MEKTADMVNNSVAAEILKFWREAGPSRWFDKSEAFDNEFRRRFAGLHQEAAAGELNGWIEGPESALALLLLLDQFPRNCFRGTPRMYATDPLARDMAKKAIAAGLDRQVDEELRIFFYLPLSHSEEIADHDLAVAKNRELPGDYVKHALGHQTIVRRFGRFPHRNAILGRQSTKDEKAFLEDGGFAG